MVLQVSLKDLLTQEQEMMYVDTDSLSPGPWQVRKIFTDQSELQQSIAEHGVLEPLLVKSLGDGKYCIIGGERRWRAAKAAEVKRLPVRVLGVTDDQALKISMVENVQRDNLSPLEEARGYQALVDRSMTQEAVAQTVGKSRSHIANALRLLKLPQAVQDMVESGKLSAGQARSLVGVEDCEKRANEVLARGSTVRDLEQSRKAAKPKPSGDDAVQSTSADVAEIASQIAELVGMKVTIADRRGHGTISIKYNSWAQVDALLELLYRTS